MLYRITLFIFLISGSCAAAEQAATSVLDPWMPAIGEAVLLLIKIVGPVIAVLVSALLWRILSKLGIDRNASIDALIRTYVKQGINYAEGWASKQVDNPSGEHKKSEAIKYILSLIRESKLPNIAEEKISKMIESQLAYDKKK